MSELASKPADTGTTAHAFFLTYSTRWLDDQAPAYPIKAACPVHVSQLLHASLYCDVQGLKLAMKAAQSATGCCSHTCTIAPVLPFLAGFTLAFSPTVTTLSSYKTHLNR